MHKLLERTLSEHLFAYLHEHAVGFVEDEGAERLLTEVVVPTGLLVKTAVVFRVCIQTTIEVPRIIHEPPAKLLLLCGTTRQLDSSLRLRKEVTLHDDVVGLTSCILEASHRHEVRLGVFLLDLATQVLTYPLSHSICTAADHCLLGHWSLCTHLIRLLDVQEEREASEVIVLVTALDQLVTMHLRKLAESETVELADDLSHDVARLYVLFHFGRVSVKVHRKQRLEELKVPQLRLVR